MAAKCLAERERLMRELELQSRERLECVRMMLRKEGGSDIVAELDRRLKESENGVTDARSIWHSISDAQRRVLILLASGPVSLRRIEGVAYAVVTPAGNRATGIRLSTLRNLASRGLLQWTGGAFDPEASAEPTERMNFVMKHGRPAPGAHFEGFRP